MEVTAYLQQFLNKEKIIAVIGLGYVGLPIALLFAKRYKVLGYDINPELISILQNKIDPTAELTAEDFEDTDIFFSADAQELNKASLFIVAVPTPIDEHNNPDLSPLILASELIAKALKPGDFVVFESTVYPGCTEEVCIPILEKTGLVCSRDFDVGYSPERINPGDREHRLHNTNKIISAVTSLALQKLEAIYAQVIKADLHKAPSIKVAEAAKIVENTQRDINIALMNEFSLIFSRLGINTYDVLEAASTKWNFQKFLPGLVGGHCIGVDPYYLTYKASEVGYHAKMILAGRAINDGMGIYVANAVVKKLVVVKKFLPQTRVLVMGVTFKENVQDIRNSRVKDLIQELHSFNIQVDVTDPFARAEAVWNSLHLPLLDFSQIQGPYDAVIVAVAHKPYLLLQEDYFLQITSPEAVLFDVKGIYRNRIHQLNYWSL
ncbi:MAG: nucleotide sugar dehydrogenase [Bacteroidia bacterium]|nr:nucleotide sugar dehydrogenase [Bacteroidia bacterium]MDW8157969.1 nucleotide sugar dehydrogenase [Bacteroidia bacterium]